MTPTFINAQIALLRFCRLRTEHFAVAPIIEGATRGKLVERIFGAAWLREVGAKLETLVWRKDVTTSSEIALKETAAGCIGSDGTETLALQFCPSALKPSDLQTDGGIEAAQ